MQVEGRIVMVLGATGLVGGELLRQLLGSREVARVVAPGRRLVALPPAVPREHAAKLDARVVDFDRLERTAEAFNGVSQIFCALGTTIRQAGSQERFRRVDHDYPVEAARLGLRLGARHFLLVSAIGADAGSRVFYNRVKGEVERDIRSLGYRAVTIVRPSLLLGERGEFRLGEEVAKLVGRLAPRRWAPVHVRDVARVLVDAAERDESGVRVVESGDIPRAAA
jgi:uncharacterized protein YbjT (DUF2867 family)